MDLKTYKEASVRGGRASFNWENVKNDKYRTNYLGHSLMAPSQRGNKDPTWYSKADSNSNIEREEKSEIERVKELERKAMAEVLGYDLDEVEKGRTDVEDSSRERRTRERRGDQDRGRRDRSRERPRDKLKDRSRDKFRERSRDRPRNRDKGRSSDRNSYRNRDCDLKKRDRYRESTERGSLIEKESERELERTRVPHDSRSGRSREYRDREPRRDREKERDSRR